MAHSAQIPLNTTGLPRGLKFQSGTWIYVPNAVPVAWPARKGQSGSKPMTGPIWRRPQSISSPPKLWKWIGKWDLLQYTVQLNPEQCTSCNNCVDACSPKALTMAKRTAALGREKEHWDFFKELPEFDRTKIDVTRMCQQQLQEPLFKYPQGVDGCGGSPLFKVVVPTVRGSYAGCERDRCELHFWRCPAHDPLGPKIAKVAGLHGPTPFLRTMPNSVLGFDSP